VPGTDRMSRVFGRDMWTGQGSKCPFRYLQLQASGAFGFKKANFLALKEKKSCYLFLSFLLDADYSISAE
jgi:hypothetical protein